MNDITSLKRDTATLMKIFGWQVLIESIFRGILSMIIFYIVLVKRKRRELFLWMVPLFLFLNNSLNIYLAMLAFKKGSFEVHKFIGTTLIILFISNGTFVAAHWIFSA